MVLIVPRGDCEYDGDCEYGDGAGDGNPVRRAM
jgi:hypothetical protein